MTRRLSEEDELELVIRYKLGAGVRALAERFEVAVRTVPNVLRRHGAEVRPVPDKKPELTAEIVRLRKAGKGWREVAALAGCSPPTARKRYEQWRLRGEAAAREQQD